MNAAFRVRAQMLPRIYGVAPLKCSGCGGRVRVVGFITEPATVRQILEHVGEPASAPAIAPAGSPPVAVNGQQLIAPEAVEAIPELEFDQTTWQRKPSMIGWWPTRVRMQSRSRTWSLIRHWGGNLRCRDGTCGGAWSGIDQALVWCGECSGQPNPDCRQCAISACYAHQISANTTQKRSLI